MNKEELDKLRERWSGLKIDLPWITRKINTDNAEDGCIDLRALEIREVLKNLKMQRVDMSHSIFALAGQINMCRVTDSKFVKITLGTNLGKYFERCDFSDSDLRGALFRGEFKDCVFANCNLNGIQGTDVKFIRCNFDKSNLKKSELHRCFFKDCSFSDTKFFKSTLSGSKFKGIKKEDLALDNVYMPGAEFDI